MIELVKEHAANHLTIEDIDDVFNLARKRSEAKALVDYASLNGISSNLLAEKVAEFRQKFAKDVIIDHVSYRKYGHNEGDEPRFTQPVMYKLVDKKRPVREMYADALVNGGRVNASISSVKPNNVSAATKASKPSKGWIK